METGLEHERHPARIVAWLVFVLAFTLLSFAGRAGGAEAPDDLAYRYSSSVAVVVQFVLVLGILLLIGRGLPRRDLFALRRPPSWGRALGLAALGLGAIYAMAFAYGSVLSLFGDWDPGKEQGLVPDGWDPSRAGAFAAFFLSVSILAPIVEELTYRGMGISLLLPYGALLAVLLTGVIFGAAHGLVVALPILVVFGVVNAWLRLRTGSVYPPMLLHGTFNAVAMLVAVSGTG